MPIRGVKGGLPFVPRPNRNQVISTAEVQLCKDGCPLQELEGRWHQRQRITILYRDVIQPPIVNTGAQRTILLLHEEEPRPSWRGRGMYNACYQRILNIPLHGLPLRIGQREKAPHRWGSARQQINRKVVRAMQRHIWSSGLTEHRSQVMVSHRLLLKHRTRHDWGKCSTQTLR